MNAEIETIKGSAEFGWHNFTPTSYIDQRNGFAYSLYTDLVYKAVFGKNARQLRETLKLDKKESLRDHFSEEELRAVQSKEFLVSGLIGCGMSYQQIRDFFNTVSLQETGLQVKE